MRAAVIILLVLLHATSALAEVPGWEVERERAFSLPAWSSEEDLDAEILALARVCAHEAGYESPGDCVAIREVHVRLAVSRRTSVLEQAWRYSPRALSGRSGRSWFAELGPWCMTPPDAWPGRADWSLIERLWAAHLEDSARVVAGKLARTCGGTIHDWGAPRSAVIDERVARLGLIPVPCSDTVNRFFARPSIRASERSWTTFFENSTRGRVRARARRDVGGSRGHTRVET